MGCPKKFKRKRCRASLKAIAKRKRPNGTVENVIEITVISKVVPARSLCQFGESVWKVPKYTCITYFTWHGLLNITYVPYIPWLPSRHLCILGLPLGFSVPLSGSELRDSRLHAPLGGKPACVCLPSSHNIQKHRCGKWSHSKGNWPWRYTLSITQDHFSSVSIIVHHFFHHVSSFFMIFHHYSSFCAFFWLWEGRC